MILNDRETVAFLADRLNGNGGSRGHSSDAMIAAAVCGHTPAKLDYPRDLGDFGRCCEAFSRAPKELREAMLPILRDYLVAVSPTTEAK